ncbi:MAG: DUF481 domain-containing protein [Gammaproteobacteria bacterium]
MPVFFALDPTMYFKAIVLSATLVLGIPAVADDDEDETPLGWAGTAGLGFLSTTGNSDTTNWNVQADVTKRTERWEHVFKAVAIGAETDGTQTAERYGLNAASRRDLNKRSYVFGRLTYDKDGFSSYPKQITETIGYGRRVLTGPMHLFNVEFGAGARQADFIDTTGATSIGMSSSCVRTATTPGRSVRVPSSSRSLASRPVPTTPTSTV